MHSMKRIFPPFAYGNDPRAACWWNETCTAPVWPTLSQDMRADVAVVGGGFTGLSAALHLAEAGANVVLLEAETPGWGASGRNGGFCCLGGAKLPGKAMRKRYGALETDTYEAGEAAAVELVATLLDRFGIDADRHSKGETLLAHKLSVMKKLRDEARVLEAQGVDPQLVEQADLRANGLNGAFFGAITRPEGFALNPLKYLSGLSGAAKQAGAGLFQNAPCQKLTRHGEHWKLQTPNAVVNADQVIIATNGYSSENVPNWLAARYMPAQSTVMVTRPLDQGELDAQGWTSDQMAYDSRHMLHYFRLMPDRRFLFGARGGLQSSEQSEQNIKRRLRRDFDTLFPTWSGVEATHSWSGMVCLSRNLVPFVGPVPDQTGLYAGLCYHGNGVATGTFSGRVLADLIISGGTDLPYSGILKTAGKFPFGAARRLVMPFAYAVLSALD